MTAEPLQPQEYQRLTLELEEMIVLLETLYLQGESIQAGPELPRQERFMQLAELFELNEFEQFVLALALAQELFPVRLRTLNAELLGLAEQQLSATLTPYVCLQFLGWGDPLAFRQDAPLQKWNLLRLQGGVTPDRSMETLTIAPGVLLYAQGHDGLDPEVQPFASLHQDAASLSDSQQALLEQARKHLARGPEERGVMLYGLHVEDMQALAGHLLSTPKNPVLHVRVADLAGSPAEHWSARIRTLGRDLRLKGFHLLLDATGDPPEGQTLDSLTGQLLDEAAGPVVVMAPAPMPLTTPRALLPLEVTPPSPAEQRAQWAAGLGVSEEQPLLAQLGDQFRLSLDRIGALAREARLSLPGNASHAARVERAWDTARTANRRLMGGLAERVATRATWDDLILPPGEASVLRQIAAHVRHRSQVYEQLGMARPGRGRAITALFSGPSGTGKTLSAEVLAQDLNLDLYRIDLSSTVSKYIGETEKNLRKIFDAADQGGCILLFDEADSVFGKRGEVRDSNDRYANIQVNYLLQRLETFNGLAVLTTNLESSMDVAFMRRIQFVLNFRAPQPAERERLWRLAFPPGLDSSALDFRALAQADVSGGNIRSVAMNAVFMAVSRGEGLSQEIVTEALHLEYRKLGRLVL
ncbi:ATP-binding protein [Deinococcus hohokamensis]|uniref:ATP-binding protein n=1 Tax=Deinococcus hohokamensis TaxID=309883 RepID=A0ABV9IC48_9DEIO